MSEKKRENEKGHQNAPKLDPLPDTSTLGVEFVPISGDKKTFQINNGIDDSWKFLPVSSSSVLWVQVAQKAAITVTSKVLAVMRKLCESA